MILAALFALALAAGLLADAFAPERHELPTEVDA